MHVVTALTETVPAAVHDSVHCHGGDCFADASACICYMWCGWCPQVLPSNGKRYHEIRQGKIMLPTCSMHFQRLMAVSSHHAAST